jgi:Uma2 family endonuclease
MATALATELITAEEYLRLPDNGDTTELVRGRIVIMNRPYTAHGYFCLQIGSLLKRFADDHDLGRVVSNDSGVVTSRDPDTVRGPDVAFYSYERVPRGPVPLDGYWPAPDLVFEVRSPDDRWKEIHHKVGEFLHAGVSTVVVTDPAAQTVHVFSADRPVQSLTADGELALDDVLPGFRVPVRKLFE